MSVNARLEKLNQESSHHTFLFLQLVIQGHSNYIGAYKRLKVPRIIKNIFLRIVKMKKKQKRKDQKCIAQNDAALHNTLYESDRNALECVPGLYLDWCSFDSLALIYPSRYPKVAFDISKHQSSKHIDLANRFDEPRLSRYIF